MAHSNCDNRQEFKDGAYRDGDKGKINYIACFSPLVLEAIGEYLRDCAVMPDDRIRPCDNWKQGITLKSYMESKFRHLMATWKAYEGYSDPEKKFDIVKALCAECFNTMGPLHEILQERLAEKRPKRPTMVLKRDKIVLSGELCPNCKYIPVSLYWNRDDEEYNCTNCGETYKHLEVDVMDTGIPIDSEGYPINVSTHNKPMFNTELAEEMAEKLKPELKIPSGKWEENFACFVIRDVNRLGCGFLGDGAWVACREDARRFTKQGAIEYINRYKDEKFIIEDAT